METDLAVINIVSLNKNRALPHPNLALVCISLRNKVQYDLTETMVSNGEIEWQDEGHTMSR